MNNDYLDLFKQSLENPEVLSQQDLERLITETGGFLKALQEDLENSDSSVKERAISQAAELESLLRSYLQELSPFEGINLSREEKALVDQGLNDSSLKINHKLKPFKMS